MKRILFGLALLGAAVPAFACRFQMSAPEHLRDIVNRNGGLDFPDEWCSILASKNLGINFDGDAAVMDGKNIGWAIVKIYSIDTDLSAGSTVGTSTHLQPGVASQPTADQAFYAAVNSAIKYVDIYKAAAEIDARKAALRRQLLKQ